MDELLKAIEELKKVFDKSGVSALRLTLGKNE